MFNVVLAVALSVGVQGQDPQPIVLPSRAWVSLPEGLAGPVSILPVQVGNETRVRLSYDGKVFEGPRLRIKANGRVFDTACDGQGSLTVRTYRVGEQP